MRFPRQARVFHGQLDAAPVAGVVLLLVIFMQVSALLHTPGLLVHLDNPEATIHVSRDGRIRFGTNVYSGSDSNSLRMALQRSSAGPPFELRADPNTSSNFVVAARKMVGDWLEINPAAIISISRDGMIHFGTNDYALADSNSLRIALRRSSAGPPFELRVESNTSSSTALAFTNLMESLLQIRLPIGSTNLAGTANPTVEVRVDFGRYFYEHRLVNDKELRAELSKRLHAAAARSEELTVSIAADDQVPMSEWTPLEALIREVGIKTVLIEERTEMPPPPSRTKP
jgi:biopolymer transport protein ExbD